MATLGKIRKAITPDTARDVKIIAKMFKHIAQHNPEAVIAAFGPFLTKRHENDPDGARRMVEFYADNAEYLIKLFDYQ